MRIISGRWRGRRLRGPAGMEVRPTTDRTREALFSILGSQVRGCIVLDLCCGAGGLGLEALSRGATRAIFVDQARHSLEATRANLELCGAEPDTYRLETGEAMAWLKRWAGPGGAPWILFCDPPYQSGTAAAMMAYLGAAEAPAGLVCAVSEHGAQTPDLPTVGPGWKARRYGASHLAIYRPGAAAPQPESAP
jgi:16S rRNA (guanine966-N2)-methyltransferase